MCSYHQEHVCFNLFQTPFHPFVTSLFSRYLGLEPEKAMAPHLSTLAWRIPQTEEPGGLQSMGSLRVRHEWATSLSLFTSMHWRRKWQPTPVSLPGESQGRGAWWAAVYEVAQSRIRLKWLSSSSRFGTWQHWHHEYSYNYYVAKNSWVSKQTLFCHCIYQIWCIIHTHTHTHTHTI